MGRTISGGTARARAAQGANGSQKAKAAAGNNSNRAVDPSKSLMSKSKEDELRHRVYTRQQAEMDKKAMEKRHAGASKSTPKAPGMAAQAGAGRKATK
ncbi:hypothetical protein EVG20_g9069 [Dentipellis fragilis]|uniref:Uncharacterized protein n=1 Tax=Dentipellis fragilis TaxID=205917 RepID=A0A4Y9Y0S4_9AGAM|nr:hypothetical protein EVG20_g9069 [Dentipellis fragilis]